MSTRIPALACAVFLAAAPAARAADAAYVSLVGLADASATDRIEEEGELPPEAGDAGREAVVAPAPRAVSAWTRLFRLLLPSAGCAVPELRASTAAFVGARPVLSASPARDSREAEEGARRGMADMLALMSAGVDPLRPAGR